MRGIPIVSKNNNSYFYNDETGFIELKGKDMPEYIKVEKEPSEDDDKIIYATADEIKEHLFSGNGFKQMILEVTQGCNLMCKYCCFGEHYKSNRKPSNKMMSFETGKKAIDYYMELFAKQCTYSNPCKNPSVGFYGGEPLLNFEVIKKLVEYIKTTYPNYKFDHNITTNGLLLNEEVSDFLVENGFAILVSLDGDKENHDRNRVKQNGEGSFDEVFKNVKNFQKRYPDYYKFSFSTCYDYGTDLEKLKDFIEKNQLFVVALNMISSTETDYYNQFSEEQIAKFNEDFMKLQTEFNEVATKGDILKDCYYSIHMPLFAYGYFQLNNHSLLSTPPRKVLPFTGSCVPGEKIFIASDGAIHICERITNKFSIGDLENGLDYNKMAEITNVLNANQKKCKKCDISRLCNICFSQITCGDKLIIDHNLCKERKKQCEISLKSYIDIMEENPEEFIRVTSNHIVEMVTKTDSTLF